MRNQGRMRLLLLLILGLILFDFNVLHLWGTRLRVLTLLIAIFILVYLAGLVSGRYRHRGNGIEKYVALVFWIALLSAVNLFDKPNDYIFDFVSSVILLGLYVIMILCLSGLLLRYLDIVLFIRLCIGFSIAVSLYAIYQTIASLSGQLPALYLHPHAYEVACLGGYCRPAGTFSEPAHLAAFLLPSVILLGTFIVTKTDTEFLFNSRKRNILSFSLIFAAFIFAYAEGPYAALLGTGLIMLMLLKSQRQLVKRMLKGAAVLVIIMIFTFMGMQMLNEDFLQGFIVRSSYTLSRVFPFISYPYGKTDLLVSSYTSRFYGTIRSIRIWYDHPLFGVGLNNTTNYIPNYTVYAHGKYLDITSEPGTGWGAILSDLGLIGVLSLAILYRAILRKIRELMLNIQFYPLWSLALAFYLILWSDILYRFISGGLVDPRKWVTLGLASLIITCIENRRD